MSLEEERGRKRGRDGEGRKEEGRERWGGEEGGREGERMDGMQDRREVKIHVKAKIYQ